jgi:response regulator RpfG family c-di-GMP phosphodiesterase
MGLRIVTLLGFREERMEILEYGALLHDMGKIGIKDEILRKTGAFSPEGHQTIQEHPLIGVKIVEGIEFSKDKVPIIRHHYEHFDGEGYPDGLVGEAIPLEDIVLEMEKHKGKQFDPNFWEIFLQEKIINDDRCLHPGNNGKVE